MRRMLAGNGLLARPYDELLVVNRLEVLLRSSPSDDP